MTKSDLEVLPLWLSTDSATLMPMKRIAENRITVMKNAIAYIVVFFLLLIFLLV